MPNIEKYPLSQKITKKVPSNIISLNTPKLGSNRVSKILKLPACPSNKTPRNTLISNPLLLD